MTDLHVTLLLFDGFSNMVLACLLEPLRAVRDQTQNRIDWSVVTPDDKPAISSSGLSIGPNIAIAEAPRSNLLVVISGYGYRAHATRANSQLLQALARRSSTILGADTAAWLLAEAGLLKDRTATLHWQVLSEFAETFPDTEVSYERFVKNDRIWTCGGASTALDLMLAFIGDRFGPASAFDASTMFLHDAARQQSTGRGPGYLTGKGTAKLRLVLNHMVETIEFPVTLETLARNANVSLRALDRLFLNELGMPPGRYYQLLRLSRARELAANTELGLREIALRCGYCDAAALGKAFRRSFGFTIGKSRGHRRGTLRSPETFS